MSAVAPAAPPLDLTPLLKRLEKLEGSGKISAHKASEANGLVRDVKAKVEALEAAAALQAASSGQLKSDFEALAEGKASRSDLEAVSLRAAVLEQQKAEEAASGADQTVVALRLSALESALADLRVRGVLEQQVETLTRTKGDAAVFTAKLGMMSGELRRTMDDLLQEERAAVNDAMAQLSQRQDDTATALDRFAKGVEANQAATDVRLQGLQVEAAAPRVMMTAMQQHTTRTVAEAVDEQRSNMMAQQRRIEGLRVDLNRSLTDPESVEAMVARGVAEALKVKDEQITRLVARLADLDVDLQNTLGRDEALAIVNGRVDQLLDGAMYGPDTNVVPSSSSPPPPLSSSKRRNYGVNKNNNKNNSNDNNGGSRYDATGKEIVYGDDAGSIGSISTSSHSTQRRPPQPQLTAWSHASSAESSSGYLYSAMRGAEGALPAKEAHPPCFQPVRWRPVHGNQKPLEHMKVRNSSINVTSRRTADKSLDEFFKTTRGPEGKRHSNRPAALKAIEPAVPPFSRTPNTPTTTASTSRGRETGVVQFPAPPQPDNTGEEGGGGGGGGRRGGGGGSEVESRGGSREDPTPTLY